jgi:hypothetical protein
MKIFKPCQTFKEKDAIGYWKDEEGKLFVDYIKIVDIAEKNIIPECQKLFSEGEKAVYIQVNDKFSYIINADFSTVLLKNNIYLDYKLSEKRKALLLKKYNGFTVLNNGNLLISKKV